MGKKKINDIIKQLTNNLYFLIGSVVKYRSGCSKNCTCNNGERHIKFYLSTKKKGKTKNFYLPPNAVGQAGKMTQKYKKLQSILKDISRINYEKLKKDNLTRIPQAKKTK